MPALKTYKALAKRVKVTKNGKILKRKCGQDHFNSRETGNTRRNKRRDIEMPATHKKTIMSLLSNQP
ncbi:MAG: 50S ribosomal protein L35 [Patescibacteria group bacterium]|jgi:large subunit ribosomal protein L35